MKRALSYLSAAGLFVVLSGQVFAQGTAPAKVVDTSAGKVFADSQGMTLYFRDSDKKDQSLCTGKCATLWPPFKAANGESAQGDWTIVARSDGSKQWAYKGHPLYLWSKDKKSGDVTGDGVAKIWHAAKPS